LEFVESIQTEGVSFEHVPMGDGAKRKEPLIVEVDTENKEKDLTALDIPLPKLSRRYQREFKDLGELNPAALGNKRLPLKAFTPEETREIVFKTMLDSEIHHTVYLDGSGPADYRSVVAFFARQLLKDLRLVGGYDLLYPKVRDFIRDHLFEGPPADLEDAVVIRNLSEPEVGKVLYDSFKSAINALTISDSGSTRIEDYIRLSHTRPFRTDHRPFLAAKKCIFTKTVGEANSGGFELSFAAFLEAAPDVQAFAKNYFAVGFKLDYVKADGDLSNYVPDFIVRDTSGVIWIIETKGRKELDLPQKMARLKQWCADATAAEENGQRYDFIFVDQEAFEKHTPATLAALVTAYIDFKA
jgi:type III restriction enzyme